MRTANYSDFLSGIAALIGVDQGDFSQTELNFFNVYFNRSLRKIWEMSNWTELCPYGEARFLSNNISFPNDLTQAGCYTFPGSRLTPTANVLVNPLDARVNGSKLFETSSASAVSYAVQATTPPAIYPTTGYIFSGYAQPISQNPRNYIYVSATDGTGTWGGFFNLQSATVGTTNFSGTSATAAQFSANYIGNGWVNWSMSFTSTPTPGASPNWSINLSADGVTTSYIPSPTGGIYSYGNTLLATNNAPTANYYIPWTQSGETAIDVLFDIWNQDPSGGIMPYRQNINTTANGIQMVGMIPSAGPYYLYYRPQRPLFTGSAYSSSATYTTGQELQYTSTTSGFTNYYTATTTTTAGQNPDANSSSFAVVTIPYIFIEYCKYNSYADWLLTEGQHGKAQMMYSYADSLVTDEADKQERQQGNIMPWQIYTHVTSQNRGLGYQGQNFTPGTATIN